LWFAEQTNSFLSRKYIWKEFLKMARVKSTSGKGSRTSKTQTELTNPGSGPVVNTTPAAESASAETKPEPAITSATKPTNGSESTTELRPETKMFEVRKADSRKNVVPINLEDEIRRRAYELYEQRDPGAGSEADDWFAAEREVMQRYRQQSA
jgi:hypothetical protein